MDNKLYNRTRIKYRIRKKVSGTATKPRLSVFRSNKQIYCQLIDDINGVTLASASSKGLSLQGEKKNIATEVGKLIASKAKSVGVESVVFDRGGYLFHGRVKSLADGAREGGLNF
ncbi:MAG TPA: 50S ribosomal protein L18 [Saprospiraceae bacterium]|jgi:large subunit ribosomal protein L18|nr:50S ribosomal protein L18 [Saprospiraceae bacterium]HRO08305.1 50S ribosomal protein L18 [Saprospiraceae bacterium]HRO73151.1 50S ribosomal protein L18 [Saprospiraceae bacterium]HRP37585.1 50S ribosomal protein L18 [Candidatus Dojkabacteria bacterium]HRP41746.1 50S ribosomal protein L18 [Saprospiraceae bacterium]